MSESIQQNDIRYYLSAHCFVQEVRILSVEESTCVVQFTDRNGGLRIRKNRLYQSAEEAKKQQHNPVKNYRRISFLPHEEQWMFHTILKEPV